MIMIGFFSNYLSLYVITIIILPEVMDVMDVILYQYLRLIKIECSFIIKRKYVDLKYYLENRKKYYIRN